jgi:hypothetical protein
MEILAPPAPQARRLLALRVRLDQQAYRVLAARPARLGRPALRLLSQAQLVQRGWPGQMAQLVLQGLPAPPGLFILLAVHQIKFSMKINKQ